MKHYGWEMSGIKSFVKKYWFPIICVSCVSIGILFITLGLPFWVGIAFSFLCMFGTWKWTGYIKKEKFENRNNIFPAFLGFVLVILFIFSLLTQVSVYLDLSNPDAAKTVFLIITIFLSVVLTARGFYTLCRGCCTLCGSKPKGEPPAADKVNGGTCDVKLNFKNLRY